MQVSDEPLRNDMEDEEVDLEKNYHLLNLYQRIIVFLKRLFQKKDKLAAVEDLLLVKIARDIERTYPGLLRYKTGEILEPFYNDIKELQEGLSFLVPILKGALGPE
jgi:hypothetical protein